MPFPTHRTRERPPEEVPKIDRSSIPFSMSDGSFTVHALERPPMEVNVSFVFRKKIGDTRWSKKASGKWRYRLSVPWQYFIVRVNRVGAITDTFLWLSRRKLESIQDGAVYMPPLPNIYPSGHICNGTIRVDFNDPIHLRVQKAFESFWTTPFTEETWPERGDILPRCYSAQPLYICYGYLKLMLDFWQKHDAHNRNGGCGFPFRLMKVVNKAMPSWHGHLIESLADAMEYGLQFRAPTRDDLEDR